MRNVIVIFAVTILFQNANAFDEKRTFSCPAGFDASVSIDLFIAGSNGPEAVTGNFAIVTKTQTGALSERSAYVLKDKTFDVEIYPNGTATIRDTLNSINYGTCTQSDILILSAIRPNR